MDTASSSKPLVSVVVPTHNRPHFLREALASALTQTYRNIEILVRDNASAPETRRVVESFGDPRIQYHRHAENVGQTRNVIDGCVRARGAYVTSLHDDDAWEPEFLERLVAPLEQNPTVAISFSDHYIMDAAGKVDITMTRRNSRHWKRDRLAPGIHHDLRRIAVVDKSIPLSMAAVMRKSAIDWRDVPDLPSCYDLWLMYLVCRDGQAGYYVPERLTRYRVHNGSETALGRMRLDQGYLICSQRMLNDERMRSVWPDLQIELARAYTDLGVTLVREGRVGEGRPYLKQGLELRWTLRALALWAMSYSPRLLLHRHGQTNGSSSRQPLVLTLHPGGKTPLPVRENH